MFNWLKPSRRRKSQDRLKTLNYRFLQDPMIRQQINRLQTLVGVTREDFQALYIKTIEQYMINFGETNSPTARSFFIELLDGVILALKKRRGYLLPLGADSETSFREREEWTFSVFSAALFKQFDSKTRFDFAKKLLPPLAFSWLKRNENLFDLWQCYLQDDGSENVFTNIVGDKLICAEAGYQENCVNTQSSNEQEDVVSVVNDTIQPISTKQSKNVLKPPLFSGHDFWSWLKEGIATQMLTYNQVNSVIHGVELGLFICMPQAVELFFSDQFRQHNIDMSTVTLTQRIELTKAIKKQQGLVRNVQGSSTHVYCIGQWQDRKLLSGLVMPTKALFTSDFILPINPNLAIDPVINL